MSDDAPKKIDFVHAEVWRKISKKGYDGERMDRLIDEAIAELAAR